MYVYILFRNAKCPGRNKKRLLENVILSPSRSLIIKRNIGLYDIFLGRETFFGELIKIYLNGISFRICRRPFTLYIYIYVKNFFHFDYKLFTINTGKHTHTQTRDKTRRPFGRLSFEHLANYFFDAPYNVYDNHRRREDGVHASRK